MYKSRLCIEMRFQPRFSDQVSRNRVDSRHILRDLYNGIVVLPMLSCTSETCTMDGRQTSRLPNKNAPQDCEAFGAENETRTLTCNILIVNDLVETEKTSGET